MEQVKRIYEDRVSEIENYLRFVLLVVDDTNPVQGDDIDKDSLRKTLKATAVLVLYNLMEATVREVVQAIFDELKVRKVSYDDCSDLVKRVVLENHKKHNPSRIQAELDQIAFDIVHKTFNSGALFNGNVDGRKIREAAKDFGFKDPSTGKYQHLLTIKNARNNLAHGFVSFNELGKDMDESSLNEYMRQVKDVLKETIENVQEYINTAAYRKTA